MTIFVEVPAARPTTASTEARRQPGFRARFLDWAEPRGFEAPTTAESLRQWVADYLAATHDSAAEAAEYLAREA